MGRAAKLRAIYLIALANIAVLALWGVLFDVPAMLGIAGFRGATGSSLSVVFEVVLAMSFLIAAAPLAFLAWRPMGWGKLLLPAYAVAWLFHAGILMVFPGAAISASVLWTPLACAALMIVLAVAHQIVDPTFFRRST